MTVFGWEQSIIEQARTWPRSGVLFDAMNVASDFSISKWFILIIVFGFVLWKGWKTIWPPALLAAIAVGVGDIGSRRLVKAFVMRPRPDYFGLSCMQSSCWGFVSSHSTNIFAAATILILYDRRNGWFCIPIALLVSFSRIYLADHYPMDVLGGALLGTLIGYLIWKVVTRTNVFEKFRKV